ncbi:MAG: ATP-binding cassette domain-containing protein [Oscillospiraceae bacterium]|nr:ATP-binding cassette domain-containing protein [Oscillospiraceae bacterium]
MPKKVMLAPPENVMVQADNLVKIYKSSDVEVMALQGLDLTVERGELMGIVGASGSGKSTLLNMLGGLDRPSAGALFVDGKDMLKFTEKDFIEYKRKTVGFVWQNNARNLIPYLSAQQNVEMPLLLSGFSNRSQRASELLDMVGLSHRKNSRLDQMSGGEQQRVAIAIALSNNPKLLLADEPTGSVDTATAKLILDVFRDLNKVMGVTIIIVTHDTKLSAQIDRVVAIRDGKTSTELVRKTSALKSFGELSEEAAEAGHEELSVLDRAGRLQIPKEYLEELGIKGGDKVRVELEDGRICIYPRL